MTLLHVAAQRNYPVIIEELLANGLGDLLEAKDNEGRTPFFVAFCNNAIGAVKALLKAGANPSATNKVSFVWAL